MKLEMNKKQSMNYLDIIKTNIYLKGVNKKNMRTLNEIVEMCKGNERLDYDELRYALLVYVSMMNRDHRKLRDTLLAKESRPEFIRKIEAENSFNMYKTALNKSPKEYLGWNNDPENPEYQKFHKMGSKLVDRLIEEK